MRRRLRRTQLGPRHARRRAALLGCLVFCSGGCARRSAPQGADAAAATPTDTDLATMRCAAAGAATGEAPMPAATLAPSPSASWLSVRGGRIVQADGTAFHGRGANLADPRGCGACACVGVPLAESVGEVTRRMDALVDGWGANFLRLDLESYARGATGVLDDPAYLAALQQIVAHLQGKAGTYMVLSVWFDPSLDPNGWPTEQTAAILSRLTDAFAGVSQVMFGLSNEPRANADGAADLQVWARMNAAAAAIRAAEAAQGAPAHIILAQGTRAWARRLDYYVDHPLTAGDGSNVAYETHVYDHASAFAALFEVPAATLPVIIGEFGPTASGTMTLADTAALMERAEAAGIPYLAWTFHGRCVPSLLLDSSGGGCGLGMPLTPSAWGSQLRARLQLPW